MGDTKISSKYLGEKQGSVMNRRTYRIPATVTDTNAHQLSTNGEGCVVHASVASPTVVEAQVYIKTLDGGTSPTISVGTNSTTYTNLISGADTKSNANVFLPGSNAIGKLYLEADTAVFYKLGGTPTGGVIDVILTVYGIDTNTKA